MQTLVPPRILIVDDEERNRKLLDVFLRADGLQTIAAVSGQQAIAKAIEELPDLILLDLMMPGMDGFEVVRWLKRDSATKHIPVVGVSSLDDAASRNRMRTAGADEVISKPIDRWALSQCISALLPDWSRALADNDDIEQK